MPKDGEFRYDISKKNRTRGMAQVIEHLLTSIRHCIQTPILPHTHTHTHTHKIIV
jgi:hypothetical protein